MSTAPISLDFHRAEKAALQALPTAFEKMRALSRTEAPPSLEERRNRLTLLEKMVRDNKDAIADAICKDFGNRSKHESLTAEIFPLLAGIQHARSHLRSWMRAEGVGVHWAFLPASAKILPQPLGVIGVVAPWNYPFQLGMMPLACAMAAGNRVLLKPSELTPNLAQLTAELIAKTFDANVVHVVNGGPELAEVFCKLPFDHLVFTGSTRLGHVVMRAAAENLTPVTLELGGKSPTVIQADYPLDLAMDRVLSGKLFNAGQTCIAPDYLMVPTGREQAVIDSAKALVALKYPTLEDNPDYTSIVNDRHYARLQGYLAEARSKGAQVTEINPANEVLPPDKRKMAPTIVVGATDDMQVMQDEIFGPILPIVTYNSLDEAIAYINARPRPLALYYFDRDGDRVEHMLQRTTSGGVCINETVMHFAQDNLPFGGVGPSGMGAYHGKHGFDAFSHRKAVFLQSRINGAGMLSPPYGPKIEKLLRFLIGT